MVPVPPHITKTSRRNQDVHRPLRPLLSTFVLVSIAATATGQAPQRPSTTRVHPPFTD